ncbi:hypothetical protein A1L58_12970 [Shewanella baltica]|uniref:Dephospho-CoA kinase/protein folding accessory domain-containing protein n=3 Tax=Shewanella TaxID=22 RepID=A3D7A6_SHEB5|nr:MULTISPECIES: GrpB family protein [Shewanella]ABN62619.1 protein of unknown function UPF0157 [Shewanella baltica OS155]AEH14962.1 protein of unknown function UPF0157 [Shewanella baltica OS117]KZK70657.1 hypothetical protein A1L58_12970 [Shewanella baltica]MCS6122239.1 GrpB family protein [Shewanella baltica]MCS6177460.1 GrpB family protein [Shewanella baltica]
MKVEIVDYNSVWPQKYESEKKLLLSVVGNAIDNIHHIGSTSIEGLAAKPIIDIIIESPSLDILDSCKDQFELLGYEALGEFGMSGRRYYRKGGEQRTYQIHAFVTDDKNVHRHIAFREYLKANPEVLTEYEELKRRVARECNNDISVYCDGKNDFIQEHEAKALERWQLRT